MQKISAVVCLISLAHGIIIEREIIQYAMVDITKTSIDGVMCYDTYGNIS